MKTTILQNTLFDFPENQVDGHALKPITQVLLDHRATTHFKPDPVPDEYVEAILRFAAQASSGHNLPPWRFIIVRERESRRRLQKAAMNQAGGGEAPIVIIAFAIKDDWKNYIDSLFQEGVRRGAGNADEVEKVKQMATDFLNRSPAIVWLNRHTMIAFTTMMLVAEAYGLDTASIEGFDPEAVKRESGLPAEAEVIGLLAIGFAQEPDKVYGGRPAINEIVYVEKYGQHFWSGQDALLNSAGVFADISRQEKEGLKPDYVPDQTGRKN